MRAAALEAGASEDWEDWEDWSRWRLFCPVPNFSDLGTHLMPVQDKTVKFKMIVF